MPPPADAVDAFIEQHPAPIRNLLQESRDFLHAAAPGLQEGLKWNVPAFMMERNLFYLHTEDDHVVLDVVAAPQLAGHESVFDEVEGGAAHVHVRSPKDLEREGLREAVRAVAGFHTKRSH